MDALIRSLAAVVGPAHVLTEPALTEGFAADWTGRFHGATPAVVRPASTPEVAAVLALCDGAGVPVVPQGGNTGLVGGGVPLAGEVVLSLRRLDVLGPVDGLASQVTAGAGVTLAALQAHAAASGLRFAVDLAARDSATVGGMVATNAGGTHVVRHGPMRAQVVGVEAVLADGRVLSHLGGLLKDNTGYDLAGLLTGSEGTLAVVTAARLRLVGEPPVRVTVLVGLPGIEAAVRATAALRAGVAGLEAVEALVEPTTSLVCRHLGLLAPPGGGGPVHLLAESGGEQDQTGPLGAALAAAGVPLEAAAVAVDPAGRARLWRFRDAAAEAIAALGVPHKLDVTLPAARLAEFVRAVPGVVAGVAPAATTYLFGHVGDGNVHVNVVTPGGEPPEEVDGEVLQLAAGLGGSISAEHGVGVAKRRWLHLCRSADEVAVMRAVKHALDPRSTLNPNALLPEG